MSQKAVLKRCLLVAMGVRTASYGWEHVDWISILVVQVLWVLILLIIWRHRVEFRHVSSKAVAHILKRFNLVNWQGIRAIFVYHA